MPCARASKRSVTHYGVPKPSPTPLTSPLQLRLRVYCGQEAALGPGRVDLLERIVGTESIAQAARDMGMSYMKAWKLIQSMNRCFREPVLEVQRGGKGGGTARLTSFGQSVLTLYRQMERDSLAALHPAAETMAALLRPSEA